MSELVLPPNDQLDSAELLGTVLVLHWRDGHRGELPLKTMRDNCPCAVCEGQRGQRQGSPLRVLSPSSPSEVEAIHPVGRYALQLHWRDGHSTGIYSFDLLRAICQCPECAAG